MWFPQSYIVNYPESSFKLWLIVYLYLGSFHCAIFFSTLWEFPLALTLNFWCMIFYIGTMYSKHFSSKIFTCFLQKLAFSWLACLLVIHPNANLTTSKHAPAPIKHNLHFVLLGHEQLQATTIMGTRYGQN